MCLHPDLTTPREEQTIMRAASKGSAALAHSEQMIFYTVANKHWFKSALLQLINE